MVVVIYDDVDDDDDDGGGDGDDGCRAEDARSRFSTIVKIAIFIDM